MTGARDITQLCFSSNVAGIVANKTEQSFYSDQVGETNISLYLRHQKIGLRTASSVQRDPECMTRIKTDHTEIK